MDLLKEVVGVASVSGNENQQQQQQVSKMHRQKLNQHQILPRRKWSDWSECSAGCFRTRHRTNCDDLVAQNSTLATNNKSTPAKSSNKPADSYTKRQVADKSTDEERLKESEADEPDEGELLMKADQVEDDDYADEGDEEDETDSCANVDPNKTFERRACLGGLCRPLVSAASNPNDEHQLPPGATTIPPGSLSTWFQRNKETHPSKTGRYWDSQHRHGVHKERPPVVANGEDGNIEGGVPQIVPGQQPTSRLLGRLDQQANSIRTRPNSTERLNYKNVNHFNGVQIVGQPFGLPDEPNGKTNDTFNREPVAEVQVTGAAPASDPTATRNMWPRQLLNSANDALGPQANLIHWTILIGALLTIILLIMLIMRKLLATALPSYHWMLAKQTIKSSSKSRLGSASGPESDSYDQVPYAFHAKSSARSALRVAPGAGSEGPSSLLVETADYRKAQKRLEGASRPPHHMSYAWRHHNQPSCSDSSGLMDQITTANLGFRPFMVDTNGCHLLGSSKFNTDQQQEVYVEPYSSQVSNSTGSSEQRFRLAQHQIEPDSHSIQSANYNTLGSGQYGNLASSVMQDKGFVLTKDFVPSTGGTTERRISGSYHRSMTRKPKVKGRRRSRPPRQSQRGSSDEASSSREDVDEAGSSNKPTNDRETRSASMSSSADESPSVQSTTAQLLSHAASSSFEQPPEFEGSIQTVSNPAGGSSFNSSPTQASPASLGGGKLRHNKLTCLAAAQTVQSQPNSPMFVNQFNNRSAVNHRLHWPAHLAGSSSHSTRPFGFARSSDMPANDTEPKYDQPKIQNVAMMMNDDTCNDKTNTKFMKAARMKQVNNCDNDDRHFYEEIQSQHQSEDN